MRAPRLLYPVRPGGDDVTTQLITQPYHLPRDGGPAFWHLGALLTFKATSEQTAGRMLGQGTSGAARHGPPPCRRRAVEVRGHDLRRAPVEGEGRAVINLPEW